MFNSKKSSYFTTSAELEEAIKAHRYQIKKLLFDARKRREQEYRKDEQKKL